MTKPAPWHHLDLFSGIGGFALAARWIGWETVAFCEVEPFPCAVLAHHWPEVPNVGDIRTADFTGFRGRVDILTGGFPCQDISIAGKGVGLEGARSGLWFEMLRAIEECRPRCVVCENVPALRHRGIDVVLDGLEGAGYTAWPLVVGADTLGAPHRRKRVWIVGRLGHAPCGEGDERGPRGVAGPCRCGASQHATAWGTGEDDVGHPCGGGCGGFAWRRDGQEPANGCGRVGWAGQCDTRQAGERRGKPCDCGGAAGGHEGVADTDRAGRGEQRGTEPVQPQQRSAERRRSAGANGTGQPRPVEPGVGDAVDGLSRWLAGCAIRWPARPGQAQYDWEAPRTGRGIPNRTVKLKALGNAIVPACAYAVFCAIERMEEE